MPQLDFYFFFNNISVFLFLLALHTVLNYSILLIYVKSFRIMLRVDAMSNLVYIVKQAKNRNIFARLESVVYYFLFSSYFLYKLNVNASVFTFFILR